MNKIVLSKNTSPYFNLACEEFYLKNFSEDIKLFLWQSQKAIVVGNNQNAWKECNVKKANDDGVDIARRLSGGGCVFHDLGNLNYSFVINKEKYDEKKQLSVILEALKSLGVDAEFSGRNDLLVNGKKISGTAYCFEDGMCLHHGTLLINADITKIQKYLNVSKDKLKSKGVDSVSSRVTNLNEVDNKITLEKIIVKIKESFEKIYGKYQLEQIDENCCEKNILEIETKNRTWDWIFGNSPKFDLVFDERFRWGNLQIFASFKNATIQKVQIYSDFMDVDFISRLKIALIGFENSFENVNKFLNCDDWKIEEREILSEVFEKWFGKEAYFG